MGLLRSAQALIATVLGLVRPSDIGVRAALVGETMPADRLMGAMSIQRTTLDSARIVGALTGAGLVAALGIGPAYLVVAGFYVSSVLLTLQAGSARAARHSAEGAAGRARLGSPWRDLREGFAYVRHTPHLLAMMCLAFLLNLTAFPLSHGLLPYVARDVYGIRVAKSAFGYKELGAGTPDITRAQHCRAEVWLAGRGWVAMDPADVGKVMRLETADWIKTTDHPVVTPVYRALFGGWEGNWMGYNVAHDVAQPGLAHSRELDAGDGPVARLRDAQLGRDRVRGAGVVARDHDHSHARAPGHANRVVDVPRVEVCLAQEAEEERPVRTVVLLGQLERLVERRDRLGRAPHERVRAAERRAGLRSARLGGTGEGVLEIPSAMRDSFERSPSLILGHQVRKSRVRGSRKP